MVRISVFCFRLVNESLRTNPKRSKMAKERENKKQMGNSRADQQVLR